MIRATYVADSGGGVVRRTNQDNFYMNGMSKPVETRNYRTGGTSVESCQVFAVCDGMGGEQAGEIAAALAVERPCRSGRRRNCARIGAAISRQPMTRSVPIRRSTS